LSSIKAAGADVCSVFVILLLLRTSFSYPLSLSLSLSTLIPSALTSPTMAIDDSDNNVPNVGASPFTNFAPMQPMQPMPPMQYVVQVPGQHNTLELAEKRVASRCAQLVPLFCHILISASITTFLALALNWELPVAFSTIAGILAVSGFVAMLFRYNIALAVVHLVLLVFTVGTVLMFGVLYIVPIVVFCVIVLLGGSNVHTSDVLLLVFFLLCILGTINLCAYLVVMVMRVSSLRAINLVRQGQLPTVMMSQVMPQESFPATGDFY
jgi:hypothetical protein